MSTATKLKAERDEFCALLQKIAHGYPNKPIAGTEVQQIVRGELVRRGIHWSPSMTGREEK